MSEKLLRLRYPATCLSCGGALAKGTEASWNRETKTATCATCLGAHEFATEASEDAIERGEAGGSAAREWRRRHDRREQTIRSRYGKLSTVVLALSDDPHSTAAWAYGANGERTLGTMLDPLRDEGLAVLHDRRIPGSKANIDHLVVGPWGVFVVDAKNYKGRVEKRDRGGFFSTDYRLYVGGRDKTALVAGMTKQAQAVRAALAGEDASLRVCKTICFVDADWSLLARAIEMDGVHVLWPSALGKLIRTEGMLLPDEVARIERKLALALPAA